MDFNAFSVYTGCGQDTMKGYTLMARTTPQKGGPTPTSVGQGRPTARRPRRSKQTPGTKFRPMEVYDGDEWIIQRCQPGASVLVDRSGEKVEILRTDNFKLRFDERLRKCERFFDELHRYVADNAHGIDADVLDEICERLEDELLHIGENFNRGFPERLIVLLPDQPLLERKIAQIAKPLDNLRQLADQDYYEYTPAHLRAIKVSLGERVRHLRQGFKVGQEFSRIKGGSD